MPNKVLAKVEVESNLQVLPKMMRRWRTGLLSISCTDTDQASTMDLFLQHKGSDIKRENQSVNKVQTTTIIPRFIFDFNNAFYFLTAVIYSVF